MGKECNAGRRLGTRIAAAGLTAVLAVTGIGCSSHPLGRGFGGSAVSVGNYPLGPDSVMNSEIMERRNEADFQTNMDRVRANEDINPTGDIYRDWRFPGDISIGPYE